VVCAGDRASGVARAGALAADDGALDAGLVTATDSNVAFSRRHGFDVRVEVDLPGGPRVWMLARRFGSDAPVLLRWCVEGDWLTADAPTPGSAGPD